MPVLEFARFLATRRQWGLCGSDLPRQVLIVALDLYSLLRELFRHHAYEVKLRMLSLCRSRRLKGLLLLGHLLFSQVCHDYFAFLDIVAEQIVLWVLILKYYIKIAPHG